MQTKPKEQQQLFNVSLFPIPNLVALRIGIITGLFDRKSEYRIRSVACLFYERVAPYDE